MFKKNRLFEGSLKETLTHYKKRHPLVKRRKPVLLVVDVQRYFFDSNFAAFIPDSVKILPRIKALIGFFYENNLPVIFTRHIDVPKSPMHNWWKNIMRDGDYLTELLFSGENVITKSAYDAFYETELEERLRALEADQLYICGVQTHLCISTTARSAFIRGFNPVVITDATASKYRQLHTASLMTLGHGFAVLANVEEVTRCLSML